MFSGQLLKILIPEYYIPFTNFNKSKSNWYKIILKFVHSVRFLISVLNFLHQPNAQS